MIRVSPHFYLEEFVPPYLINRFGEKAKWYVSDWQIRIAEELRSVFGDKPMTINNWHAGGSLKLRGTRLPNTTIGAYLSQHKMKCAIDFTIRGMTAHEVNAYIQRNAQHFLSCGITTIEASEATPTWTHVDCRLTAMKKLLIVNP